MRIRTILVTIAVAELLSVTSNFAIAQDAAHTEKEKVVSRMYQLIYLPRAYCSRLKDMSIKLDDTIDQVNLTYPKLKTLVDNSPYFHQVDVYFKSDDDLLRKPERMSDEELTQDCGAMYYMLHQFLEADTGPAYANSIIQILEK